MNVTDKKERIGFIILFFALTAFYVWYHQRVIISSDSTTMLPLANDWLSGNYLLRDWIVGTDDFFFSETLFYLPGLALGSTCYKLLYLIPSMVFAALILSVPYVFVWKNECVEKTTEKVIILIWYIVLVGALAHPTAYTLLNANSHNNLYVFVAVEISFLELFIKNKKVRYLIFYIFIGTLVMFSEGIMLMVLIAPVCTMCLYYMVKNIFEEKEEENKFLFSAFWGTVAIYVLAIVFEGYLERNGGLLDAQLEFNIVEPREVLHRIEKYYHQALMLWGYSFSGENDVERNVYNFMTWLILVAVIIVFLVQGCRIIKGKVERLELLLWLMVFFNILGCLFIDRAVFFRYLIPSYLFGMILLFLNLHRCLTKSSVKIRIIVLLLISAGSIYIANYRLDGVVEVNDVMKTSKDVGNVLEEKRWGNGYGDFWSASVNACFTDFKYNIYPVISNEEGFVPYGELIKKQWYYEEGIHYIILKENDSSNAFCRQEDILKFLGDPDESIVIGEYKILYWDTDLAKYMQAMF